MPHRAKRAPAARCLTRWVAIWRKTRRPEPGTPPASHSLKEEKIMQRLEHKHPRPIRWMHWINVPLLVGMIWSGLVIYWANDVYRIGFGETTLFHFFPDWFYAALGLSHRLAEGLAWHFAIMWLFAINGLCYVAYTFVSGEWRHLVPNRYSFREAWMV